MAKNELDKYIKKSKKGDKSAYRVIIAQLYDEINNLTAFLYDDEETQDKLTKHLFIKAYKNIAEYDEKECDIHLWMAREAVKELYKVVSEREGDIFPGEIDRAEYEYESIEEDDELGEASAEFNEGFITSAGFDCDEPVFAELTMGEKLVYLLYCYVGYTIDEIEDICNIDSSFIVSEIAKMRVGVLEAYAPIKEEMTDALEDSDAAGATGNVGTSGAAGNVRTAGAARATGTAGVAGVAGAAAGGAGRTLEADGAEDDESDYDDEAEEFDDDIDIYNDEKPVKRKNAPKEYDEVVYQIGPLAMSSRQFKWLIVGAAAVAVAVVIVGVVALASSNSRRNSSNSATTTNSAVTTTQPTTAEPTTEAASETEETTEEETTTARRVQSGTQPDVEFNTTAAPTEATTAAATTVAPTTTAAATTAAPTTTAAETTAATTTAAATTAAPTTEAPTTTAADTTNAADANAASNAAGTGN